MGHLPSRLCLATLPPRAERLRAEVKAFLQSALEPAPAHVRARSWMGFDAGFSRRLAARGWVGVTLPAQFGGAALDAFSRYALVEELLAAGAPVSAHWIAARQSGPLILTFGTAAQQAFYLPRICRAEAFFCIGMSEPNSGSDLASVCARAARAIRLRDGGNDLRALCAAMAASLRSGAMQRSLEMALDHCNTRVQFGKSIGKFQAIQQQMSLMAEHVAAGAIAAESAFQSAGRAPTLLAAAIAKSRTSEAAGLVAATAHAVHGAIGMTDEYELGLLTRRLHQWRLDYGAEQHWNQIIGAQLLAGASGVVDFVRTV